MAFAPLHALRVSELYRALETLPGGLAPQEAAARLSLYGPNILYEPATSRLPMAYRLWRKFASHLTHVMSYLLLGSGGVALFIQPVLGVVILFVVLINAGFSFWQEHRAEQAIATLRQVLPAYARVIRAGQEIKIPASELVPGDVLVLAEGDHISADARVVEGYGLRANHATLTGDAMPARKTAEASLIEGLTDLERPNLIFAGTSVVSGTGRAVVFATGMLTQFGRIAQLTQTVDPPSVLQKDVERITRTTALIAVGAGVIFFIAGLGDIGMSLEQAFLFAIGIIVAITPEGLLPTLTLSLAMAVQRLAKRGVLVKKLAVVETLGKVSVICTDKSGTLTQNQMTVREVWVGGQRLKISGVGYEPLGNFSPDPAAVKSELEALLAAAELCNNSRLVPPSPECPQWKCLGDQTEAALRVLARKGGMDERLLEQAFPRIHELPFDARRKRMSTIHRPGKEANGQRTKPANPLSTPAIAFVKGAPREVLDLCTHILIGGEVRPLDTATRAKVLAANDDYARNALRVLALARSDLLPRRLVSGDGGAFTSEHVERNLIFLGLAAMLDPPRPEVAEAIRVCREASIRIVMVTGDYGLTAESLARRIGMLTSPHPRIITGAELDEMKDADVRAVLNEEVIFARMAPEHKLRLVAAFQASGEVVAVTGDGVNDAPALRKADVGIAMGIIGTDVSKEAADVILTEDKFNAITAAIEEGRAVYDNIRKLVTYIFASNVPEIAPFVLRAMLRVPLALTISQILAIDLGTDLVPGLALGAEKPEPDVMNRPPRRRTQPLIDKGLIARALWLGALETALCYVGFFLAYRSFGYTDFFNLPLIDLEPLVVRLAVMPAHVLATTLFHAGVVMGQVGNVFTCRREKAGVRRLGIFSNSLLLGGVAFELVLLVALIYFPPLAWVFEHAPLPACWIGILMYAPTVYILDRIRKGLVMRIKLARERRLGRLL